MIYIKKEVCKMTKHSPLACLSNATLFKDFPESLRKKLVTISTHQEYFPKGSLIRQPFDGKDGLLVMDKGKAKVYSLNENGKETILGLLNKGDSEGQEHLFSTSARENFNQATTDAWVCSMTRNDFQKLVRQTPDLALSLLNDFGQKLVTAEKNTVRRNSMDAKQRIMAYLNDLSKKQGTNKVKLDLKKKDLAGYLGITPETLSRKLKELAKENKIQVDKKIITIAK